MSFPIFVHDGGASLTGDLSTDDVQFEANGSVELIASLLKSCVILCAGFGARLSTGAADGCAHIWGAPEKGRLVSRRH